jgi:hypothetical protein
MKITTATKFTKKAVEILAWSVSLSQAKHREHENICLLLYLPFSCEAGAASQP